MARSQSPPNQRDETEGNDSAVRAGITLESVSKRFGAVRAVNSVSLSVSEGEFFSLLGPSGCGKTTLLRIVAGFESPDSGRVVIHGRDVTGAAPQKRPTAMVFQNYALFPTMTVGANVEYGLRVRHVRRTERLERTRRSLDRVGMLSLIDRPVDQLSGGQQQRVALARALAVEPEVLLFDEPLSNLDVALRERTRAELIEIQNRLGITSLYVTHDQEEALALSDRIAVMNHGRILEVGTPRELYETPTSGFVAGFLGGANLISDHDIIRLLSGQDPRAGMMLAARPENLAPAPSGDGLPVRILTAQYLGSVVEYTVQHGATTIRIRSSPETDRESFEHIVARKWKWVQDDLDDEDGESES